MKKNEVILTAGNSKLVYEGVSETMGARKANELGLYEFEGGDCDTKYPPKEERKEYGSFTGEREAPKKLYVFSGDLRHLVLSVNAARVKKTLPAEYNELAEVIKAFSIVRGEKQISIIQDKFTEEVKTTMKGFTVPDDWKEFVCTISKTAKDELKPAKSKTVKKTSPAKSKETPQPVILMAERLVELGNVDWETIDESLIAKMSEACKTAKVTMKAVREHFQTLIPETETDENFELPF